MVLVSKTKVYKVSDEDIVELLEMGGIGYWAESAKIDAKNRLYKVTLDKQTAWECDGKREYYLHFDDIAQTLVSLGMRELECWTDSVDGARDYLESSDASYLDCLVTDSVVQFVIFGELVFG